MSLQVRQEAALANAVNKGHPCILGVRASFQDADHYFLAQARAPHRRNSAARLLYRSLKIRAPRAPRPALRALAQTYAEQSDLFDLTRAFKGARLPEPLAAQVLLMVTMAVCRCHERGVIHRDIKARPPPRTFPLRVTRAWTPGRRVAPVVPASAALYHRHACP